MLGLIALAGVAVQAHAQCTRPMLQGAVDSYLAAQKAGDRSKMAFTEKPKFLENMGEVAAERGKWNTALPIAFSRSFLDVDRCKTFSELIVTQADRPYVIG